MKFLIKIIIVVTTALGLIPDLFASKKVEINSPDNQICMLVFTTSQGQLSYSVTTKNAILLETSALGLIVDSINLGQNAKILSGTEIQKIDESYLIFGNHTTVFNKANEAIIPVKSSGKIYKLIVRVYNDGVAVRYTIPEGSKYINTDNTTWNLPPNTGKIAWSGFSQSYEEFSHVTELEKIPADKPIMGPITLEAGGFFLSLSEADCETFSDMSFIRTGNQLKATFPFQVNGWEINPMSDDKSILKGTDRGYNVSPWRTTIIAKSLTDLINSDLLMNLCPPPEKNRDFSWVQPGRCLWQWWSVGSPKFDDQKNWYDAAANLKWEYYLVDDGWRYWKKPDKDQWTLLEEVITYGKSVGVKSIVWVDSKEMREADKRRTYLEKVKSVGASGIKIDFIPDATSDIMQWYSGAMQDCAELKLLLNFHGSVKPTGLRRTYPNDITREAVRGNEYHMTRYRRIAPFDHEVCLPFTRFMAGAADFTPVILNPRELTSTKFTWAHEFAQAIVFLSPVVHFTDQYKFYLESPMVDLFREVPTVWDETRVLDCTTMGEVVAFARRKDNVWWVGVMNGATERDIEIKADFLRKESSAVLIYDDNLRNTSINRQERTVTQDETLSLHLVPGGGFVGKFK